MLRLLAISVYIFCVTNLKTASESVPHDGANPPLGPPEPGTRVACDALQDWLKDPTIKSENGEGLNLLKENCATLQVLLNARNKLAAQLNVTENDPLVRTMLSSTKPGPPESVFFVTVEKIILHSYSVYEEARSVFLMGDITLSWKDKRLSWNPTVNPSIRVSLHGKNEIWTPVLKTSGKGTPGFGVMPTFMHESGHMMRMPLMEWGEVHPWLSQDGTIRVSSPLYDNAQCNSEYANYPYDEHFCQLQLVSRDYPNLFRYHILEAQLDTSRMVKNSKWKVLSSEIASQTDAEVTEAFVSIQPIDEDEVEDALGITHKDARDEIDRTKLWETDGDVIKEDIKLYFINPKGIGKDPFFVHIPVDNTQALTH